MARDRETNYRRAGGNKYIYAGAATHSHLLQEFIKFLTRRRSQKRLPVWMDTAEREISQAKAT
jgi:hypothetical protein